MNDQIKITLVKSIIGRPTKHRKVIAGMGLRKLNQSVVLENTPANRGMAQKVSHLVTVEEAIHHDA